MPFEDLTILSVDEPYFGSTDNPMDEPREIGCISVDAQGRQHYDRSQMKYYIQRNDSYLRLDLNAGYENDVRKPFSCVEKMNVLLRWIAHSNFEPLKRYSTNFVCIRSAIEAVLCTPFCRKQSDQWMICASKLNDVIYLKLVYTDNQIRRQREATDEVKRMSAWGHKFEQYMTSDRPDGVPDTSSAMHQTEEFYIIVTNRLGSHSLMLEAEIDGANPLSPVRPGSGDTSCYVEMKTSKMVPEFRSSYQFRTLKSLKWWVQSMIIGIKDIICGLRKDSGIVESIDVLQTNNLPSMFDDKWTPEISFNFCNIFLDHLNGKLSVNDPSIVYKCQYNGGSRVRISKLQNPEERFRVIPDWYVTEMRDKLSP